MMIRFTGPAMGCEFELLLAGRDRDYLVAAGEEAFEKLKQLDCQLSVFIPTSEVSYINENAALGPVRVGPDLFRLLRLAQRISAETGGAFDVTSGPLVRLWGFDGDGGGPCLPTADEIRHVLNSVGMQYVQLDEEEHTVRFLRPGMEINLGALGKGHAVDEIAAFLAERGITSGLINAGTSTVYALGCAPESDGWTVGIRGDQESGRIACVSLRDRALSTSGGYEQFREIGGRRFSHILDPRTGRPAMGMVSASAITESAAASDALSTAFYVMGVGGTTAYCREHKNVEALLAIERAGSEPEVIQISAVG